MTSQIALCTMYKDEIDISIKIYNSRTNLDIEM